MKARAQSQEETRQRIVDATMHLHQELGPRATTISAIAERAGVQRLTVYRHFPDETAVFQACTTHWLEMNPPPDPAGWADIDAPRERLRAALMAFYDYYLATRAMWAPSHRDVADVPALQEPMAQFASFVASIADDLAAGVAEGSGEVRVTVGHALTFPTWADLESRSLDNRGKVELVLRWVDGACRCAGAFDART
jgi:AcrR family transcriptional regulator